MPYLTPSLGLETSHVFAPVGSGAAARPLNSKAQGGLAIGAMS